MTWECKKCGECCNSPRLYKKDIGKIKKEGYKEEDFVYIDDLGNIYMQDINGRCMFLKKNKKAECAIYEFRPDTCRKYPSELNKGDCRPVKLAFDEYLEKKRNGQK